MNLEFLGEFDRVYCYARVSSKEQANNRLSIESQINRLTCVKPKPDRLYKDVLGGDQSDRPDYLELMEQVKTDVLEYKLRVLVVITEQSRLSREGVDKVTDLIEYFDTIGVCLYALDGGKQTVAEPHEWLMRSQEALFNKYYLLQLRRTLRSVKAQRRLEGKPIIGNPPFGYAWSREKYLPDDNEWSIARAAVFKYLPPPKGEGLSLEKCVAWALTQGWKISASGFRTWLLNPILRGHLQYSEDGLTRAEHKQGVKKPKNMLYGRHEALITENEFLAILDRLKDNRLFARRGSTKPRHPMSGLVVCGSCSLNMKRKINGKSKVTGKEYAGYSCNNTHCSNRQHKAISKLESALQLEISKKARLLAEQMNESLSEQEVDPRILSLQSELRELENIYKVSPRSHIKNAILEIQNEVEQITKKPTSKLSNESLAQACIVFENPENFNLLSDPEKRQVYHYLCKQILVKDKQIEVVLNL